ncbi:MATE family efflux transporter [Longimicrobium sp.]|uniref:MATE family efflux transporter n=1 Tax=Longimicrobium sp. TaxID=2029185 RepID=UPI002E31B0AB|nr:MATE family efflux transporter [Longimicrobium sp.]HEX6039260.1 MATE family efflux transporter [Longimicrobium sp.]
MHTLATPAARGPTTTAARPGRRRRTLLLLHELRALTRVAGPLIVGQLGGVAMTTTDTIMVGPLGAQALAAAGLANAIFMATLVICTGTLLGMSPLVAQAYGAGDGRETRRVLVQGLWMAALLAVPMTVLCLFGEPIALAVGQSPEVARLAGGFLHAIAWGVLPMLLFVAFRQYLDGQSLTRPAMTMMFIGVAVNVVGNILLIYGFRVDLPLLGTWTVPPYGLVGSGWSTTMVRWAMLVAMLVYVLRHRALRPFAGVSLKPVAEQLRRMVGIGAPIGVQLAAEVGVFSLAVVMMGWLDPVAQAAHQVALNVASTTFMVAMGTSLAGTIRVGQHVGAGSRRGVRRAVLTTYALVTLFMSTCALAFLLAPRFLLGLYTHDPAIVEVGLTLLVMAAAFQVFDGAQVAGLCALRGASDTRVPMLMTVLAYWGVGAPAAYWFGFHTRLGPQGIWLGLVVALFAAAVLLGWRVRRVLWGGQPSGGPPPASPRLVHPLPQTAREGGYTSNGVPARSRRPCGGWMERSRCTRAERAGRSGVPSLRDGGPLPRHLRRSFLAARRRPLPQLRGRGWREGGTAHSARLHADPQFSPSPAKRGQGAGGRGPSAGERHSATVYGHGVRDAVLPSPILFMGEGSGMGGAPRLRHLSHETDLL